MYKSIIAFAAAGLIASPALAAPEFEHSVVVRHGDLDLKSAAGRTVLDRRIAVATERVCGSYAGADVTEDQEIKRCRAVVARDVARQLRVQLARR